jgi:arsenate reductase
MTCNVLVLCTHNSARSALAEATLNHLAARRGVDVRAYSAGSAPSGAINPHALAVLEDAGVDSTGLRSKSWNEFADENALKMRIVITVCDSAAAEPCPFWPGSPVRVHWGYADPSEAPIAQRRAAFELTRQAIGYRVLQMLELALNTLPDGELQAALVAISRS